MNAARLRLLSLVLMFGLDYVLSRAADALEEHEEEREALERERHDLDAERHDLEHRAQWDNDIDLSGPDLDVFQAGAALRLDGAAGG